MKQFVTALALFAGTVAARGFELGNVGATLLRTVDPSLVGSNVPVAMPEPPFGSSTAWQVNPGVVGQPANLFTYISSSGTASNYPNAVGTESGHANAVGSHFFGTAYGIAPGVAHVDNYEASYFYSSRIAVNSAIAPKIVNQSFNFGATPPQTTVDVAYDNYAANHNTLFVSGVGFGPTPGAPSTAYNGIGVAAFGGSSSLGPTADNGRCKPDICAPGEVTSYASPLVAGAAAILRQAALRGDGGLANTNSASDIRTLKALLLNGAVKPSNWTNGTTTPLDARWGSGILNVYNSWRHLMAGKVAFIESTTHTAGGAHPPGANANNISSLVGWDLNSISSSVPSDRVNHYYFQVTNEHNFTATLAWNRQANKTGINNLDLFLYDVATGNLVASSVSAVDNVEHLHVPNLPAGRYDLQVFKSGGVTVSNGETYALAYAATSPVIAITRSNSSITLAWPLFPAGMKLQSAATLSPPISWGVVTNSTLVTNNQNRLTLPATASKQYFRLAAP